MSRDDPGRGLGLMGLKSHGRIVSHDGLITITTLLDQAQTNASKRPREKPCYVNWRAVTLPMADVANSCLTFPTSTRSSSR